MKLNKSLLAMLVASSFITVGCENESNLTPDATTSVEVFYTNANSENVKLNTGDEITVDAVSELGEIVLDFGGYVVNKSGEQTALYVDAERLYDVTGTIQDNMCGVSCVGSDGTTKQTFELNLRAANDVEQSYHASIINATAGTYTVIYTFYCAGDLAHGVTVTVHYRYAV